MAFSMHLLFTYISLIVLSLYHVNAFKPIEWPQLKSSNLGFSWQNCGPSSDPLQIKSLSVGPDPLAIPGNLILSFLAGITSAVPDDIYISVTMEKKVAGFFIKVPCVDNVGSCNYGNICDVWAKACPTYFAKYGIPCTCPIPPNTYTVNGAVVPISVKIPSLVSGEFRITADVGSGSGHIGCLRIDINLKA